jgi:hypothetical protein
MHVVYYDADDIYYAYSTDNGSTFTPWEEVCTSDTVPALALDNSGIPYIVYGKNVKVDSPGPTYHIGYYIGRKPNPDSSWKLSYPKYPVFLSAPTSIDNLPHPPSLTISRDSGYVAFQDAVTDSIRVSSFKLPLDVHANSVAIAPCGYYPSIGYDYVSGNETPDTGRIVVVVNDHYGSGALLYYRRVNSSWNSIALSNFCVDGAPSLYAGVNQVRIAFEGMDSSSPPKWGLWSIPFTWAGGGYTRKKAEFITEDCDADNSYFKGYSFLPAMDVVVWKFNHDIWYSRRTHGQWSKPANASYTPTDSSYYPQGVAFWEAGHYKILTLWTEQIGDDYYLVRNIRKLPDEAMPPDIRVAKQGDDVEISWPPVTRGVSGDTIECDHYETYRASTFNFVPDSVNLFAQGPDTSVIDEDIRSDPENRNYLVFSFSTENTKSAKSNMGYVFKKFVNENAATTDRNWMSLPWYSNYSNVDALVNDLSPAGDPLTKIVRLRDDNKYESYAWDPEGFWDGINFAIESGRAYEMITTSDDTVVLVGSNKDDGLVTLNENPTTTDRNWVSIPYNHAYTTVSDITTEYCPAGYPVTKITNLRNDNKYESYVWDPEGFWDGVDFEIERGRGYEFVAVVDTTWNPTEYSNGEEELYVVQPKKQGLACLRLGASIEPDRAPAWSVGVFDRAVKSAPQGTIDYCCAAVYTLNTEQHKVSPAHRKSQSISTVTRMNQGSGAGFKGDNEDEKISHVVRAYIVDARDYSNILFTAYRPEKPKDVLTEQMVGSAVVTRDISGAVWFDVGNFQEPWKDGEEVVLIVEATKDGKGYCAVETFKLDGTIDIQDLGKITLEPILGAPGSNIQVLSKSSYKRGNNTIIGYSVYRNDKRINEKVLTETNGLIGNDINVKLVIKGGYETVYRSHVGPQSIPGKNTPVSFDFSIMPNPFVNQTRIDYALPKQTSVEIVIYDVSGRQVKTMVSEMQNAGYYSTIWNGVDDRGRKVASGVYFIRFKADEFRTHDKVLLVR